MAVFGGFPSAKVGISNKLTIFFSFILGKLPLLIDERLSCFSRVCESDKFLFLACMSPRNPCFLSRI